MDSIKKVPLRPIRILKKPRIAEINIKPVIWNAKRVQKEMCSGKTHPSLTCTALFAQFEQDKTDWTTFVQECRTIWKQSNKTEKFNKICTDVQFYTKSTKGRYPRNYTCHIPICDASHKVPVCATLYRFIYDISEYIWTKTLSAYWDQFKNGGKLRVPKIPALKCKGRKAGPWLEHFQKWVPTNLPCEYSHYAGNVKCHARQIVIGAPDKQSDLDYIQLYCLWMKDYDINIYKLYGDSFVYRHRDILPNHFVKIKRNKKGHPVRECCPSPTYDHWKPTVCKVFNFRFKAHSVDTCNRCKVFQVKFEDAQEENDTQLQRRIMGMWNLHKYQARWGYQVTTVIDYETNKSWNNPTKPVKVKQVWMKYKGRGMHLILDFDKDRNEIDGTEQRYYNKEKPQFVSLNFHQTPLDEIGPNSAYIWSKGKGGKTNAHMIAGLKKYLEKHNIGAEHLFVTNDYQFVNQYFVRFLEWICNPQNPDRMFVSVSFCALAVGHSYNRSDVVNSLANQAYRDRKQWTRLSQRKSALLKKGIDCEIFTEFEQNSFFDNYYKPLQKWKDIQWKMPMLFKDHPFMLNLGQSWGLVLSNKKNCNQSKMEMDDSDEDVPLEEKQSELDGYEWKYMTHPGELYAHKVMNSTTTALKDVPCVIPIINAKYAERWGQMDDTTKRIEFVSGITKCYVPGYKQKTIDCITELLEFRSAKLKKQILSYYMDMGIHKDPKDKPLQLKHGQVTSFNIFHQQERWQWVETLMLGNDKYVFIPPYADCGTLDSYRQPCARRGCKYTLSEFANLYSYDQKYICIKHGVASSGTNAKRLSRMKYHYAQKHNIISDTEKLECVESDDEGYEGYEGYEGIPNNAHNTNRNVRNTNRKKTKRRRTKVKNKDVIKLKSKKNKKVKTFASASEYLFSSWSESWTNQSVLRRNRGVHISDTLRIGAPRRSKRVAKMRCICKKSDLERVQLFDFEKANPNAYPLGLWCDMCSKKIIKVTYQCPNGECSDHETGYDVCRACKKKQTNVNQNIKGDHIAHSQSEELNDIGHLQSENEKSIEQNQSATGTETVDVNSNTQNEEDTDADMLGTSERNDNGDYESAELNNTGTQRQSNRMSKMKCICKRDLKRVILNAKEWNDFVCDICNETIKRIVYRCTEGKNDIHSDGYDVCMPCKVKQTNDHEQTESEDIDMDESETESENESENESEKVTEPVTLLFDFTALPIFTLPLL